MAAVVLPVAMWLWLPRGLNFSYMWEARYSAMSGQLQTAEPLNLYIPFELFGFSAGSVVLLNLWRRVRRSRPASLQEAVPVVLPTLVYLAALLLVTELSFFRTYDYTCYEKAAQALDAAKPLYVETVDVPGGQIIQGSGYLYPPLLAETLRKGHQAVVGLINAFGTPAAKDWGVQTSWLSVTGQGPAAFIDVLAWVFVYYLYQCLQFLLVCVLFGLLRHLARELGIDEPRATLLIALLLLVNNPLFRTIRHNQVNLWVLDLTLGSILLLWRRPILSGLLLAPAAHLKLYPVILLLPWTLGRRWRVLAGALAGVVVIVAFQTGGFTDFGLWRQFAEHVRDFPIGVKLRDNSISSLAINTLVVAGVGLESAGNLTMKVISPAASIAVLLWLLQRYVQRQRLWHKPLGDGWLDDPAKARLLGHTMDALALMLLISPMVWEHHYVMMLPVYVWTITIVGRRKPWLVLAAGLLLFALPTFDLYPFSYHRLAGLILTLWLTRPRYLADAAASSPAGKR